MTYPKQVPWRQHRGARVALPLLVGLLLVLMLFVLLLPPATVKADSRERGDWLILKRLTVLFGGAGFYSDVDLIDNDIDNVDELDVDTILNRARILRYQDVKDDAANAVRAAAAVLTTTSTITQTFTQPDYPRNLVVTLASAAQRSAGTLVLTGVDAQGNAAIDALSMTAITTTEILTGVVPFASLTSVTIPTQTNPMTITLGLGSKFGVGRAPLRDTSDVFGTRKAGALITPTVNATHGTIDVVTIAANDDFTFMIKE